MRVFPRGMGSTAPRRPLRKSYSSFIAHPLCGIALFSLMWIIDGKRLVIAEDRHGICEPNTMLFLVGRSLALIPFVTHVHNVCTIIYGGKWGTRWRWRHTAS